jgi:uncharacterized protein (DUF433 family)
MTSEQLEMISTDPRVMHGQAVIAGTRVPVSAILDCLAAGMNAEQIAEEYPSVTLAGVRAAAAYGAALARGEVLPMPHQARRGHEQPSAEALRPFIGQWVAVRGDEVLVAASSPVEVVSWLAEHEQRAQSMFRVAYADSQVGGTAPR